MREFFLDTSFAIALSAILVIQENIRAVGRLAGYNPNKVNNDIDKKLSNQPKSKSK
jgi:hypothetical protein